MKYFRDEKNPQNYSYATFEESLGGRPLFICKEDIYFIVPVINQGIYDLKSFNNGSSTPIYIDRSYYFFKGISELRESISIRENRSIKGKLENVFNAKEKGKGQNQFHVELDMGYNGDFFYAATWKVKSNEFGVLIPDTSRKSADDNNKQFFRNSESLHEDDINFLLNKGQSELDQFTATLN